MFTAVFIIIEVIYIGMIFTLGRAFYRHAPVVDRQLQRIMLAGVGVCWLVGNVLFFTIRFLYTFTHVISIIANIMFIIGLMIVVTYMTFLLFRTDRKLFTRTHSFIVIACSIVLVPNLTSSNINSMLCAFLILLEVTILFILEMSSTRGMAGYRLLIYGDIIYSFLYLINYRYSLFNEFWLLVFSHFFLIVESIGMAIIIWSWSKYKRKWIDSLTF